MAEIIIHFNDNIKVKLTDLGYQHRASYHNSFINKGINLPRRTLDEYKAKADKDGYTQFQLWAFMEEFGPVTGLGMPKYFEGNDILIST